MTFEEFCASVDDAEVTIRRAEAAVKKLARLVAGRLRSSQVPDYVLRSLKKELQDYNMQTGLWRNK